MITILNESELKEAYPRGAKKHHANSVHIMCTICMSKKSAGFCGTSVEIVDGAANKSILLFCDSL